MEDEKDKLQEYYRTCVDYFVQLRKKSFDYWFSAYYSAIREKSGWILDVGCGVGQVVNHLIQQPSNSLLIVWACQTRHALTT